ncbi:MAG: Ig domain-containing protein [Bacteroidales bacterium]|nr:Ig domain-containing protein [Bacteroidales bacterium]
MRKLAYFLLVAVAGVALFTGCNKNNSYKDFVFVDEVSLDITKTYLVPGGELDLYATVSPSNARNYDNVWWSSSDPEVVSVDIEKGHEGHITAKKVGTATITVRCEKKTATCEVIVQASGIAVTGVSISPANPTVGVGKKLALTAVLSPANATNHNVTWGSEDPLVATVSSTGVVTGVAKGTAKITVETEDGHKTASVNVKVINPVTSFTITSPSAADHDVYTPEGSTNKTFVMLVGETCQIKVDAKPADHSDEFEYSLEGNGSEFLSINASGIITAKKSSGKGAVLVKVKAKSGGILNSFFVSVWNKASFINLDNPGNISGSLMDIGSGATQYFYIKPTPEDAWFTPSIASKTGDLTYSVTSRNDGTYVLKVVAPSLSDDKVSNASRDIKSTVTLKTGNTEKTFTFNITKYDPYLPKIGDIISCVNGKMAIRDAGYRGLGVDRSGGLKKHYDASFFDVAIVAYLGTAHSSSDRKITKSSYFYGAELWYSENTLMARDIASVHGIAIPSDTDGLWLQNTTGKGVAWQASNALVKAPDGFFDNALNVSEVKNSSHQAFHNTAALLKYSNSGKTSRDVKPVAFCSSNFMRYLLGESSLRYGLYYYDGPNAARINCTCTNGGGTTMSTLWCDSPSQPRCSPWLLPSVADLLTAFTGQADMTKSEVSGSGSTNLVCPDTYHTFVLEKSLGKSLRTKSWWTSSQKDEDKAWVVSNNTGGTFAIANPSQKSQEYYVLPILYF